MCSLVWMGFRCSCVYACSSACIKDTAVSLFTLNCKEQVTSLSANSQYIMSSFELTERTHEYVLFQASSQTQLGQQFCKEKQTKVVTQLA